jgi:glyoxylase-like metal-dependent hydrolase (beta-lactamase superfamily II)
MHLLIRFTVAVLATAPVWAQGQGRGFNPSASMPFEPLQAAVRTRWAGQPLTAQKTEPFKIFDNLYYVGVQSVGAFVIPTSDGLILIDATYAETADMVLDSVKALGLNPANIKYVVVTHQHGDHFAGAGRIKQVTGARIAMSATDWEGVERQFAGAHNPRNGMPFTRDVVFNDGDTLKLGDTSMKVYVVPGHTPGQIGLDFQARAGTRTYRTLLGMALAPGEGLTKASIASMERVKQMGPWDTVIAPHGFLMPIDLPLSPREIFLAGEPKPAPPQTGHPAVVGSARVNAYLDGMIRAGRDRLAAEQAKPGQ